MRNRTWLAVVAGVAIVAVGLQFQIAQSQESKAKGAAKKMATQSESMQLRYLSTLYDVSHGKGSVIVFPFPLDFIGLLRKLDAGATE